MKPQIKHKKVIRRRNLSNILLDSKNLSGNKCGVWCRKQESLEKTANINTEFLTHVPAGLLQKAPNL